VQVVRALPRKEKAVVVELPEGATVAEALRAAGVREGVAAGIFGARVAQETPLSDGDRVEVYRPLRMDPKEARRRRARKRR
jgi:putative ubiquitin-RnfH superfamily antitoxin RatB of RatAB toxin-antitoxin module